MPTASNSQILVSTSPPEVAWTPVNVAEAFPGCFTPLAWTVIGDSVERGLRGCFRQLGALRGDEMAVPQAPEKRFMDVFYGYVAANVDMVRLVADRTPGTSGDAFEEQVFGKTRPGIESHAEIARYPIALARTAVTAITLRRRVAKLRAMVDPWWIAAIADTPDAAGASGRLREAISVMDVVLCDHMIVRMLAPGLADRIIALAGKAGVGDPLALISGGGSLEEIRLVEDVWALSRNRLSLEHFLATHGYHGPGEGDLLSRPWRENTGPLQHLVRSFADRADDMAPATAIREQVRRRDLAVDRFLTGLNARQRAEARILLKLTRGIFPLLEQTKVAFLKSIDGIRAAARSHGRHLVTTGVLDDPEQVFFLTLDEIDGPYPSDLRTQVGERRAQHGEFTTIRIPEFWVGNPDVVRTDADGDSADGAPTALQALAASGGVVSGTARVITEVEHLDTIEPDDVLVCPFTDPAWAPYMMLASALVIDIGGPFSHGAIVARELGIPCVINTVTGTRTIRTGDLVHVDGTTGTVRVERHITEGSS